MNNPLSLKLHKLFSDLEFSTLRFNFRGVGKSDGEHDGSEGELADSAIALDWLQNQNQDSQEYWICGISFGAWVGMQLLMRRPEILKFILVSPPVGKYDFNFLAPCPASGVVINADKDPLVEVNLIFGALPACLASSQRNAQRHHWSPAFKPGKPNSGRGVTRSFPLLRENSKNSSVRTAQTVCVPTSPGPVLQQPSR